MLPALPSLPKCLKELQELSVQNNVFNRVELSGEYGYLRP